MKASRLPFSGRLSRGCPRKPILAEKTPSCNRKSPQAAHSLRASFVARDWYDLLYTLLKSRRAKRRGILLPRAGTRPGARSAEGFSRPTSQVSLTLNLLGKNRLGVCKTPILLRKTALLAAYPYPSLKIPERPSAEGFYCPARARAPATGLRLVHHPVLRGPQEGAVLF